MNKEQISSNKTRNPPMAGLLEKRPLKPQIVNGWHGYRSGECGLIRVHQCPSVVKNFSSFIGLRLRRERQFVVGFNLRTWIIGPDAFLAAHAGPSFGRTRYNHQGSNKAEAPFVRTIPRIDLID